MYSVANNQSTGGALEFGTGVKDASQLNYGIGALVSQAQGHNVEPLMQARALGLTIINAVIISGSLWSKMYSKP